jgi:heme exporter protein A
MVGIALEGLACERGGRLLFEGLSLSLGGGEALLVTGRNGAGKSSLLRLICGLLPAASGRFSVEGRVALADEMLALDRDQSLGRGLRFWARLDGVADISGPVETMMLSHLLEVPVRMLSTGQRKRATLARVLAAGADVWLLDEPANGLDAASLAALEGAIARHRAGGGIVIVASHQPIALPGCETLPLGGAG